MRTELAAILLAFCGCTGIRGDLDAVRDATHAKIADVTIDVDPAEAPEARELLASPLDANTVVRIALLDNRELRAVLREMGVSRGHLAQASTPPNPVAEIEVQPERDSAISLRAEYDVTALVLLPLRASAFAPDVDAARFDAAASVVETGYRARVAFYDLAAAQQKLALANRALDALAASRDAADALFRSGNFKEIDLATVDAAYQTERADVAQMELTLFAMREALVRVLNVHGTDVMFTIRGTFDEVPSAFDPGSDIETRAITESFDLKASLCRLRGLSRRAGVARAEGWIPDTAIDVHALAPRAAPRDPSESQWLLSAGLRFTLPLLDQKRGTSSALTSMFDAELERYYGHANDIRSFIRQTFAQLATAHARARQYQSVIVPARKRVVEQALLQYNAMQISVFQLLSTERDALLAELTGIDATRDYFIAKSAFDAAMAGHTVAIKRRSSED